MLRSHSKYIRMSSYISHSGTRPNRYSLAQSNKGNTRTMCETCSKLRKRDQNDVTEQILQLVIVFPFIFRLNFPLLSYRVKIVYQNIQ